MTYSEFIAKRSKWNQVIPAWALGLRKFHPKFGGDECAGIKYVLDRLLETKRRYPNDFTAGHVFLEFAVDEASEYARFNSPYAIPFAEYLDGVGEERYPHCSSIPSPAFGNSVFRNGAILSSDPEVRKIARFGHGQMIEWNSLLVSRGFGQGHNIWWPGQDSEHIVGLLSRLHLPREIAVKMLEDFFVELFEKYPEAVIKFEFKPNIPGWRDYFPTMIAAVAFCDRVNARVGRVAMVINLEWAHSLIGGFTVRGDTQYQLDHSKFANLVHVNSAERAIVEWNVEGTDILRGSPCDDADWPVGRGTEERRQDQREAVRLLDRLGVEVDAEHDVDFSAETDDPFDCYDESRRNLLGMIDEVRQEDFAEAA